MSLKLRLLILSFVLCCSITCTAQIEVAQIYVKKFQSIGFGSFLNFSFPISESNYITIEGGLQYFAKEQEEVLLVPTLLGYRYTLNKTGTGLYVEPNAGYCFGSTTIPRIADNGMPIGGSVTYEKVAGPMAGVGFGYLFESSGRVQFNIGLRYQHSFAAPGANVIAFRVSHTFSFRSREE